ncbi:HEAT repeat domain-containing protein [Actinoplanes sp. NPDC023801]|uniref:HEAT repeat domain-containing protein n=1 Tax=Actinoplanes sp. NPDC023801 TaxID=3154595 RepID=UPI0033DA6C39
MLSDQLDAVPYPERIPALLGLLRGQADPETRTAELAAGGPYERFLAVTAAAALGFRPVVAGALTDPDPSVRAEAAKQALRLGWTTGGELLADAPPVLRHLVLRLLRKYPGSGDELIDPVRERYGDREAVALLPACTAPVVARLLPVLARSIVSWKVLARRHSPAILDWAAAGLAAAAPEPDWTPFAAAVDACTRSEPERVLGLLERYTSTSLPEIGLTSLAKRFPQRVAALVIGRVTSSDFYRHLNPGVLRPLLVLGADELAALNAINHQLFEMLPPDRRVEVHLATPPSDNPWEGHVELLPEPVRSREVRRILALPHIAANEHATERWHRLLPAAEVLARLDKASHDAAAYRREETYQAFLEVARREPAVVPEVLQRLLRVRNEREGVQRAVLESLRTLIPYLTGSDAVTLTAITDATIEARDLSQRTRYQLEELAYAALTRRPAGPPEDDELTRWALGLIARLPVIRYLETPLRPGQEHLVTMALRRRITADPAALLDLADLLETRARHVPELQELLRRAAAPSSPPHVRERAAQLWLDDPRTRAERAAELLREDPAAVRLSAVWREVSGWSTTLLDRALADPALVGPPSYVRRWTPRQQCAYAGALAAVAADTEVEQRTRTTALKNLARVPVSGRELLAGFLDNPEVPIAEAALGALPWTDRPDEALPTLLGQAGGARARAALPAADRAARFVSAGTLLTLLREVVLGPSPVRVSSRRAAIRLLARYGPPESADLFAEVWHTPGTHPDVRAAVVTAVRGAVLSPAVWRILTEAAGSAAHAEVRALLAVVPQDLTESDRPRFAALVLTACASPDRKISMDAFEHLAPWVPWAPDGLGVIAAALADPDFTGPGVFWPRGVLRSLTEALLEHAGTLEPVLSRLIALDRQDPDLGSPQRDRPARRCVTRIAGDVAKWVQARPTGDLRPARAAARMLAAEPAFLVDGAELLVALAGSRAAPLAEVADLVAGRPALAVRLAGRIADNRPDTARLGDVPAEAERLAGRGDLAGGLFALALVQAAGGAQRWSEPWVESLRRLREHPQPEVADAAYRRVMVR